MLTLRPADPALLAALKLLSDATLSDPQASPAMVAAANGVRSALLTPPEVSGENSKRWTLELNEYQRNNLALLIQVCGWGGKVPSVGPFHLLNTGDWLGEIGFMIEAQSDAGQTNTTPEQLREYADFWAIQRVKELAERGRKGA